MARATFGVVVTRPAVHGVVPRAARRAVVARPADDDVVPLAPVEAVVAGPAADPVVAGPAIDVVVPVAADDDVVAVGALDERRARLPGGVEPAVRGRRAVAEPSDAAGQARLGQPQPECVGDERGGDGGR